MLPAATLAGVVGAAALTGVAGVSALTGVAGASALTGVAGAAAWSVRGRSSSVFGRSVWRGAPGRKTIALTFDDGPSESTPELLSVLDRLDVKATFFEIGRHVRRLPSVAAEVRAAGHETGNHTDTHPYLCLLTPAQIRDEIARAQETLGGTPGGGTRWFRAPYGVRWFGLRAAQAEFGLTGVMWTVIGRDWKYSARRIAQRVLRHASPGGIVCLHDGRALAERPDIRATIDAVGEIVRELQQRGYSFATMTELVCPTTSPRESSR